MNYQGELPPLIDRDLFFGDPEISGAQLSPNGRFITFVKPFKGERNVWIKGIEEDFADAKPLTANDRPVPGYFWTHDSRNVLFVQDAEGDENYHVYAVDPEGAPEDSTGVPAPRALTSGEGVRAQIIGVPRATPGTIYVGLNDRDPAYHDLYSLDVASGEKTLVYENKEQVAGYDLDHTGALRMATKSNDAGGTEIYRVDDGGVLTKVYDCSVDETCYTSGFDANNEHIYLVSNKGDVDKTGLMLLDPQTGKAELVETDPDNEVDFGGAITSDSTHELLGTVYVGDKPRVYWRDKAWEKDYKWLKKELPGSEINLGSSTADERKFLITADSDTDPGATYLFDRDAKTLELLYKPRPELPNDDLAEMRPVRYESTDGLEIPAYLTLPKGVEAKDLPVVMFIHGGPWGRDTWGYNSYAQFWANRGYAVLQPNFRASTGYGKAFLNAGNGEWGEKMQDDITAGAQYLIDEGIADSARIGIMGGSYGGYATLAGLAFTPDVYAAGVDIVGPSNLITLLNSIPPYWASFRKQMFERMADPETDEGRAWLEERSPLNSATDITKPLLVVQGANDPRVKQAESDQIVVALRDLGRPVEYIVAPDEGHGFRRPENNMAMIAASEKFFAEYLGGRYQADMPENVSKRLEEITVDPASVVLAKAPSAEEMSAAGPTPVHSLTPGEHSYAMTLKMGEQEMEMQVTESIEKTDTGFVITQSMTSPMGKATDAVLLDSESLSLKRRDVSQGPATIELTYSPDSVNGTMSMGEQVTPISAEIDGALFSDGAAEAALVATLPLEEGYEVSLRGIDGQTFSPKLSRLSVVGTEEVTVPAGTAEAYRVEIKPADGSAGETVYFVEKGGERRVLKTQSIVPAMNGATMESVLEK